MKIYTKLVDNNFCCRFLSFFSLLSSFILLIFSHLLQFSSWYMSLTVIYSSLHNTGHRASIVPAPKLMDPKSLRFLVGRHTMKHEATPLPCHIILTAIKKEAKLDEKLGKMKENFCVH